MEKAYGAGRMVKTRIYKPSCGILIQHPVQSSDYLDVLFAESLTNSVEQYSACM